MHLYSAYAPTLGELTFDPAEWYRRRRCGTRRSPSQLLNSRSSLTLWYIFFSSPDEIAGAERAPVNGTHKRTLSFLIIYQCSEYAIIITNSDGIVYWVENPQEESREKEGEFTLIILSGLPWCANRLHVTPRDTFPLAGSLSLVTLPPIWAQNKAVDGRFCAHNRVR